MNAYALASVIVVCVCCLYALHVVVGLHKKQLRELEEARKALAQYETIERKIVRLNELEKLVGRVEKLEMVRRV